jgi:hypothetical protein
MKSKLGQRLVGVFLLLLGGGFTAYEWHTFLADHTYDRKAAAVFPAFAVAGLGALLFPVDMAEMKAKYGLEKIEKLSELPPVWWVIVGLAVAAGLGNWFALANL